MHLKVKHIEERWEKQSEKHKKRISEFEDMLDDKNETILRLKT